MDSCLSELSNSLAPSKEYTEHANRVLNRLSLSLQQKSNFSIDRIRPEGGAEKKTSLAYSIDHDITAFINGESPPFTDVLDDFQDVILLTFEIEEKDVKITSHSLQFTLEGVDFDLLPATNLASGGGNGKAWEKQYIAMLDKIKRSPDIQKAATDNSAGLTETAVQFMKKQSVFVHKVARLAKYWNSTIFYTKYLSGRSSIFEYLGVAAGRKEENKNEIEPSLLRAFQLFLTSVKDLQKLRIIFEDFYKISEVPPYILQQKPLLLDPSCPYNNFLKGLDSTGQSLFGKCAKETLDRLDRVQEEFYLDNGFPDLYKLFLPQPKFVDVQPRIKFPKPEKWLISTTDHPKYYQPNLIIRNDLSNVNKRKLDHIKKFLSAFLFITELESKAQKDDIKAVAYTKVKDVIDDVLVGDKVTWSSTHDSVESRDLSFEIPVGRDGKSAIIISCNIPEE